MAARAAEGETDIWIVGRRKEGMRHGMKLIPREGEESSAGSGIGGGGGSGSGGKKPFGDLGPLPRRRSDLVCSLPAAAAAPLSEAEAAAAATTAAVVAVVDGSDVTVNGVLLGLPDRRENGRGGVSVCGDGDGEREEGGGEGGR